ncbi:hypothetical protein SLU01_26990 [Sporosarcina luteola]|uniref:YqgU-like 6-bladed beta-propeller domain-containing protein n=1 Tax=Sporosarcina luteola TaxID=582850 RepID=A0A511ZAA8_9BACL|nr:hypothetical protein [Sporosarcina luteola]GEN84387.1 hypothetical protein SLU01_26990 [Sporosarcina luteola]
MKKIILLLFLLLIISGCSEKEEPSFVQPDTEPEPSIEKQKEEPPFEMLKVNPSTFHFIADWLSDTELLYVEKNGGLYQVKSFNIETGEIKQIYEDSSFITDVYVHPSLNYLLIHTSEQSDSAIIKVISTDGSLQHQVEIESTELSIEWNELDPEKILFTAFHEDWSYDLFVFDGHTENLSIIELEDPFPKWSGENGIAYMLFPDHPLEGGDMQIYNLDTGSSVSFVEKDVIYFDTFKDTLFIVQALQPDLFMYSIRNDKGTILSSWDMPAVSNYSEWVIPDVEWTNEGQFLYKGARQTGQLDEIGSNFNLYRHEAESSELIMEGLEAEPFKCSPSGNRCLNGYTFDELIEVDSGEKRKWIQLNE